MKKKKVILVSFPQNDTYLNVSKINFKSMI